MHQKTQSLSQTPDPLHLPKKPMKVLNFNDMYTENSQNQEGPIHLSPDAIRKLYLMEPGEYHHPIPHIKQVPSTSQVWFKPFVGNESPEGSVDQHSHSQFQSRSSSVNSNISRISHPSHTSQNSQNSQNSQHSSQNSQHSSQNSNNAPPSYGSASIQSLNIINDITPARNHRQNNNANNNNMNKPNTLRQYGGEGESNQQLQFPQHLDIDDYHDQDNLTKHSPRVKINAHGANNLDKTNVNEPHQHGHGHHHNQSLPSTDTAHVPNQFSSTPPVPTNYSLSQQQQPSQQHNQLRYRSQSQDRPQGHGRRTRQFDDISPRHVSEKINYYNNGDNIHDHKHRKNYKLKHSEDMNLINELHPDDRPWIYCLIWFAVILFCLFVLPMMLRVGKNGDLIYYWYGDDMNTTQVILQEKAINEFVGPKFDAIKSDIDALDNKLNNFQTETNNKFDTLISKNDANTDRIRNINMESMLNQQNTVNDINKIWDQIIDIERKIDTQNNQINQLTNNNNNNYNVPNNPNNIDISQLTFPYNIPYQTDFIANIYKQSKMRADQSYDLGQLVRGSKKEALPKSSLTGIEIPETINPGDCRAYKRPHAFIELELKDTIIPTSFEYIHVAANKIPFKYFRSKPRHFDIYGRSFNENENKINSDSNKIGEGTLKANENFIQIPLNTNKKLIDIIRVEFNNYDNDFTCIYRMHVRGEFESLESAWNTDEESRSIINQMEKDA